MTPSAFCFSPRREKATMIAFINEKVKHEKALQDKIDKGKA